MNTSYGSDGVSTKAGQLQSLPHLIVPLPHSTECRVGILLVLVTFLGSALAEPFLRPGRLTSSPSRAVAVKAGRVFSGHPGLEPGLGLDGREHAGMLMAIRGEADCDPR